MNTELITNKLQETLEQFMVDNELANLDFQLSGTQNTITGTDGIQYPYPVVQIDGLVIRGTAD